MRVIVVAPLAGAMTQLGAMADCTISFIRQQSPKGSKKNTGRENGKGLTLPDHRVYIRSIVIMLIN